MCKVRGGTVRGGREGSQRVFIGVIEVRKNEAGVGGGSVGGWAWSKPQSSLWLLPRLEIMEGACAGAGRSGQPSGCRRSRRSTRERPAGRAPAGRETCGTRHGRLAPHGSSAHVHDEQRTGRGGEVQGGKVCNGSGERAAPRGEKGDSKQAGKGAGRAGEGRRSAAVDSYQGTGRVQSNISVRQRGNECRVGKSGRVAGWQGNRGSVRPTRGGAGWAAGRHQERPRRADQGKK